MHHHDDESAEVLSWFQFTFVSGVPCTRGR